MLVAVLVVLAGFLSARGVDGASVRAEGETFLSRVVLGNDTFNGCLPTCRWVCKEPECPAVCKPQCIKPKCEHQCQPLQKGNCTIRCEKPECEVRCFRSTCKTGPCPRCENVCLQPKCQTICHPSAPECKPSCKQPSCTWMCKKPKTECPKPKCQLRCGHGVDPTLPEYACHHRNNKLSTFPRRGGSKSHAHPSQTQHHTKYRKRKCCSCSDLKNVHAAMLEASESISPIDEKYPSLMELNANLLYHHKKKQTDKNLPHVVGTCCPCAGDSRVPPNHRAENSFPELSVESKTRVIHRFKEEISLGENGMVDDDTEADEGLYDRDPDDNESSEEFISPAYVRQTYVKA